MVAKASWIDILMKNWVEPILFQVYIAEMQGDAFDCAEKNIHNWSQEDIQKVALSIILQN